MKTADATLRVLLVDDFTLCRSLFAEGLRSRRMLEIFEAATAEEALKQAEEFCPCVIFLNISMRNSSGLGLLQLIHRQFPKIGILVFSYLHHDHLHAERAISAGASGYISVDESDSNLFKAIQQVAAGEGYLSPSSRKKICADAVLRSDKTESPMDRLSDREFEVFCLTGHGHAPKRIAGLLAVSVKTVETYRDRIREKLSLTDGSELMYHATCFVRDQSFSDLS